MLFERARVNALAQEYRQKHGTADEAAIRIRERRVGDGGETEESIVTLAELRARTAQLQRLAPHCAQCPASIDNAPFGCIANIAFPIEAVAEEMLFARYQAFLPQRARSEEDLLAGRYRFAEWRRLGLLERSEPLTGDGYSSDEVLAALFLSPEIAPEESLAILLLFGAVRSSAGHTGFELLRLLTELSDDVEREDEEHPTLQFDMGLDPTDCLTVLELKRFFFALFVALSLQVNVRVRT